MRVISQANRVADSIVHRRELSVASGDPTATAIPIGDLTLILLMSEDGMPKCVNDT